MGLRELIDVAEGFKVFDGVIVHLYGGHIVKGRLAPAHQSI